MYKQELDPKMKLKGLKKYQIYRHKSLTELLREEKVRKSSRSHKGQDAYERLFLGIAQVRRWDNLSGARKLGSFGPMV